MVNTFQFTRSAKLSLVYQRHGEHGDYAEKLIKFFSAVPLRASAPPKKQEYRLLETKGLYVRVLGPENGTVEGTVSFPTRLGPAPVEMLRGEWHGRGPR